MNADQVKDALMAQLPPEQATQVQKRDDAARAICAERGWDINHLSIDQILAIRADERWQ